MNNCGKAARCALLLSLVLLLALLPAAALAETHSGKCGENMVWNLDTETGVLKISGYGNMEDDLSVTPWQYYRDSIKTVSIESHVKTIGSYAFSGCRELTSIDIPKSVTNIGVYAFSDCPKLTAVNVDDANTAFKDVDGVLYSHDGKKLLCCPGGRTGAFVVPEGVTEIGTGAFLGCSELTAITLPSGLLSIGKDAFGGCSELTALSLPSGLLSIGDFAFDYCSKLTSIDIPDSVTEIGSFAFWVCSKLTAINVDAANTTYKDVDGVLYSLDGKKLLCFPGGKAGKYVVPEGVTEIENRAFSGCSELTAVEIPQSVTAIADFAFSRSTKLSQLKLPSTLLELGEYAFSGCSELTRLTIPSGVTEIHKDTFDGCASLVSVDIPNTVTKIHNGAFFGCSMLSRLTIPSSVTEIGDSAFFGCSMLSLLTIPSSVTEIGNDAFFGCSKLSQVFFPGSAPLMGSSAFDTAAILYHLPGKTGWENVTAYTTAIGGDCGALPEQVFWMFDKLGRLSIFGSGAMADYPSSAAAPWSVYRDEIISLSIADGVTRIDPRAFSGCGNIAEIIVAAGNPNYSSREGILYDAAGNAIVYYPLRKARSNALDDLAGYIADLTRTIPRCRSCSPKERRR